MNQRLQTRQRNRQVNILYTSTRKTHSRKVLMRNGLLVALLLTTLTTVGILTHLAVTHFMQKAIYENPRYALKQIQIDVKGSISRRQIQQASGVVVGQNVMALNLQRIQQNVERLPYVAEAQVERQLPDKIIIRITERLPIAKLSLMNSELGAVETYYLDREGVLLRPRQGETIRQLPEITGLKATDYDPGQKIETPEVVAAINLLKLLESTPLEPSIGVAHGGPSLRTEFDPHIIDVSHPLALKVYTTQGAVITFRLDYLEQQLQRLAEARERVPEQIASIDLTPDLNVPVTTVSALNH